MTYKVKTIPTFNKGLKRLVKKYPSLKEEFISLVENLKVNPETGTTIGKNCYKIRISIKSKGKGKSGGARIVTHLYLENETVYLLIIYDKSEKSNLTQKELEGLIGFLE